MRSAKTTQLKSATGDVTSEVSSVNLTAAMNGVSNINTRLKSPSSVRANLRVQLVYPFRRRINVTSYGFACGAFTRCLTRLW